MTTATTYRPAGACQHDRMNFVRRVLRNGAEHYGHQCVACGNFRAVPIRSVDARQIAEAGDFDESIADRWWRERTNAAAAERRQQRTSELAAWRERYDAYLAGPVWAEKRRRVLERDGHRCQGCLRAPASVVHHLTYPPSDMLGQEPLYWLRALCEACHETVHRLRDAGASEAVQGLGV